MTIIPGKRTPRPRRWRSKNGLLVPTAEAVAEALDQVPAEKPWAWAALRLMPTIPGDVVRVFDDAETEELEDLGFRLLTEFPTVHVEPGVDVAFAIEADVVHIKIDQADLDRWDMRVDQLMPAALSNLRRAVGTWTGHVIDDDYEGVPVRSLEGWPHWAVSLLLLPDELQRIFGSGDQLFVAPFACNLVALPIDVDRDLAADLVDMFGAINPRSLLRGLPAFVLRDGALSIEELPGWPEIPDPYGDEGEEDQEEDA